MSESTGDMVGAATAGGIERMVYLDPRSLRPSPLQPRKRHNEKADAELRESVRGRGVLQSLLVRNVASEPGIYSFEVVFGHRRCEAARATGQALVPCIVREMSDDDVREAQLIENAQREDVHPLEEADALAELLERRTLAEVAKRVGKPASYVAQRVVLRSLSDAAREHFFADRIDLRQALAIARAPVHAQEQLVDLAVTHRYSGAALTRQALDRVLELSSAPFSRKSKSLVVAAGSCDACPKQTGNQAALFEDDGIGEKLRVSACLDRECFIAKVDAHFEQAAKKGHPDAYLSGNEASAAVTYGSGYLNLDSVAEWREQKPVKIRQVLEEAGLAALGIVFAHETGTPIIHELVRETALTDALKGQRATKKTAAVRTLIAELKDDESGSVSPMSRESAEESLAKAREAEKRAAEKGRQRTEARSRVVSSVVEHVENLKTPASPQWWRWLLRALLQSMWVDTIRQVATRRGWWKAAEEAAKAKGKKDDDSWRDPAGIVWRASLDFEMAELRALVTEIMLCVPSFDPFRSRTGKRDEDPRAVDPVRDLADVYNFDLDATLKEVETEARDRKKQKKAGKKGSAK